ncbi:NPC2 [[Candida] subhashii]|uniref:Phosphatidylglycerol/phosphatidylinositol transfer protein n=1 Tax=[Candida] subhashii TaxID=561895 RepID=A0A8J5QBH4_9ASCO|nr:NPC2 [[Candida] subhashii]KAG7662211.1 NPC2 [[Candida] subhashii]
MVSFKQLTLLTLASSTTIHGLSVFNPSYVNKVVDFFNKKPSQSQYSSSDQVIFTLPNQPPNTKPVPGDSPIEICDVTEDQLLTLTEIKLTPNPPQAGANLTFVAVGNVAKTIEPGAYVDIDVRYGFIRLIHQTFDLCEEIEKIDVTCPIKDGKQVISKVVEIPEEVPPGRYIVNAKAYTKDDEYITCLYAIIDFPLARKQ